MLREEIINEYKNDAQGLAEYFSYEYFQNHEKSFPINPFKVLKDLNIKFVFKNFEKLEGLFFPSSEESTANLVAINANRPITRQRFSAAHELCHFLKDSNVASFACEIKANSRIERFAEAFASAFLMPKDELKKQIDLRCDCNKRLTLDDVLIISNYFGTSFRACFYRIKNLHPYLLPSYTKAQLNEYKADKRRKELELCFTNLYFDLFDAWNNIGEYDFTEYGKLIFKNNYVFNDGRIENEDFDKEAVAEIIEDLVAKKQRSKFCNENYDKYCHIAGHSVMFDYIIDCAKSNPFSIYKLQNLHQKLYSCFKHPEYGGKTRENNPKVMGAKFETVDYIDVPSELYKLDTELQNLENTCVNKMPSEIIKKIAEIHHRITIIHPFGDGNGRTSRGFMNSMLIKYGFPPFYIKLENKEEYLTALEIADQKGELDNLCVFIMKNIIDAFVELTL